ncbi:MAG: glutathione S-transferase family protein [Gammaproteobacteria bacterium]|tara:strand:+ start:116 stop:973 length:858 start_codon:yes stop_codon:yes gene_type:complete
MLLDHSDIQTKEVLNWKGFNLLHFAGSACSQKLRIFLNLKEIDWISHHIDLTKNEQFDSWYLGINPRGLVPTLVHNGNVHIESNDIMQYIESVNTDVVLFPNEYINEIIESLEYEDSLHIDLRTLTFRFIVPHKLGKKDLKLLDEKENFKGTIQGDLDRNKQKEIDFWKQHYKNGITDDQVIKSANNFIVALDKLEKKLCENKYILNDNLSILDIAWFISINRIIIAGFPVKYNYPNIKAWFQMLSSDKRFSREVKGNMPLFIIKNTLGLYNFFKKRRLIDIVKF